MRPAHCGFDGNPTYGAYFMFSWFERRVNPYPDEAPTLPPEGLLPFLWHYTKPVWPWVVIMSTCTMFIAIGEVMLF